MSRRGRRGPRFNEEQKLAIVKEGEKTGVETVCAKYGISDQSYRNLRYKVLDHVASKCGTPRIRVKTRIEASGRCYFVEKQ